MRTPYSNLPAVILIAAVLFVACQSVGSVASVTPVSGASLCRVRADLERAHSRLVDAANAAKAGHLDAAASAAQEASALTAADQSAGSQKPPEDLRLLSFYLDGALVNVESAASVFYDRPSSPTPDQVTSVSEPVIHAVELALAQADAEFARLAAVARLRCP